MREVRRQKKLIEVLFKKLPPTLFGCVITSSCGTFLHPQGSFVDFNAAFLNIPSVFRKTLLRCRRYAQMVPLRNFSGTGSMRIFLAITEQRQSPQRSMLEFADICLAITHAQMPNFVIGSSRKVFTLCILELDVIIKEMSC